MERRAAGEVLGSALLGAVRDAHSVWICWRRFGLKSALGVFLDCVDATVIVDSVVSKG